MPANTPNAVRSSCKALVDRAQLVKIDESKIDAFVDSIDRDTLEDANKPFVVPLKFDTLDEELNFWALVHLLNFGSGYRHELHEAGGKGAFETVLFGMMSLAMYGNKLDVAGLESITAHTVSEAFGYSIYKEVAVATGVFMDQPTPLRALADSVVSVLHDTAATLRQQGFARLSQFILSVLKPAASLDDEAAPLASPLADALVKAFAGFADVATVDGEEVWVAKKAQLLCSDLARRFGPRDPARFAFKDLGRLTAFADNVLPAVLRHAGVITLDPELAEQIDTRKPLPAEGRAHTELRAAAVTACDLLARRLGVDASVLDTYLWKLGKRPDYRKVERHSTKDTVFY